MSPDIIGITINVILIICIIACAVTLGQIRDILKDIRDGKKQAQRPNGGAPWMKR